MENVKLLIIAILSLSLIGCATPEQPITAYRDSMQRIDNLYAMQAEIEGLTGTRYYK